jgi:hypothetical protein
MKRLFGTCLLLAGLSGCISFTAPPSARAKKSSEAKPAASATMPSAVALGTTPPPTLPSMSSWTAHPDHQVPATRPVNDYMAARTAYTPITHPKMAPAPTMPPRTASAQPMPPAPAHATAPAVVTAPTPALPTGSSGAPAPLALPAGMPVVVTPRGEQPASHVNMGNLGGSETIVQASRVESKQPQPITTPSVHNSKPVEPKPSRPGMPLMRLVNTKRITLNFEIKDVGPSGVAGVELWYTQDSRDWKKYDAPAQAHAYVIEVDEEGMYGFTLVAKSGLGLGKEPPASGDQPQVWVIVDLTKPDVQLTEMSPAKKGHEITIGWKATDSNLGRQPITLSYSEKEDGPWKVIASNLENNGKYVWQVPQELARILVRVDASDLSGNVGSAQSAKPIMLDSSTPKVSIIAVEAAPMK